MSAAAAEVGAAPRLRARDALLVALAAVVSQAWILRLPFQLDDFLLLVDPLALFTHVEGLETDDVPAFMCRIPMWLAWAAVRAVAPEPLSPVPFHVAGLALHALAAVLLARVVARHGPFAGRSAAAASASALGSGALFAVAGGAMQAVSWTAAWSSLIYTLLALGALNVALDGRRAAARAGRAGLGSAAAAGLCLYLAIITKVPALLAAAVVIGLLLLSGAGTRAWRRTALELGFCASGVLLGLLTRTWFLGTAHLRYEQRVEPGLAEAPRLAARGLHALGQALYPWNRDPLFRGDEPLLGALAAGRGASEPALEAWAIAALALAPIVLLALALAPRTRRTLIALAAVLVPAVVPPGAIYLGQPTNVVAREAYLPLAVATAMLGVSAAGLCARRRALGLAAGGLLALVFVDGNRHVARTELLHAEELRGVRALLERIADEAVAAVLVQDLASRIPQSPGEAVRPPLEPSSSPYDPVAPPRAAPSRPEELPLVLAVLPDAGFAGIPSLGALLARSAEPPFVERARIEVRCFESSQALAEWCAQEPGLGLRHVLLIGPEHDGRFEPLPPDPTLSGARNRARRMPRRWTPLRLGLGPPAGDFADPAGPAGSTDPLATARFTLVPDSAPPRWRADRPIPAHAVGAIELEVEDGAPVRGAFAFALAPRWSEPTPTAPPPTIPPRDPRAPEDPPPAVALLPIDDPGSPGTRLALALPSSLALRFGPPIEEIRWQGPNAPPAPALVPRAAVPRLEPLAPPDGATFPADPGLPPPRFAAAAPPPEYRRGSFARLELRFALLGRAASIYADRPLAPSPTGAPLELQPTAIHLDAARPTALAPSAAAPWSLLLTDRLLPQMDAGALRSATFQWRLTLHHPGGTPAARTPFRDARFLRP